MNKKGKSKAQSEDGFTNEFPSIDFVISESSWSGTDLITDVSIEIYSAEEDFCFNINRFFLTETGQIISVTGERTYDDPSDFLLPKQLRDKFK